MPKKDMASVYPKYRRMEQNQMAEIEASAFQCFPSD